MQTRAFETKITPAVSDYTWDLKAERKDECFLDKGRGQELSKLHDMRNCIKL